MTQSWNSGYVTDIAYIEGFYVQQSPARMALACLLGNVAAELPEPDDEACYLELGCGVGIGALVTAASNPGWQVTAIDYNPAHIAIGAGLARAARLDNIRFMEADLAQLATSRQADAIPQADFVSMHGLWSWVSNDVRAGIVRLLASKTRAGGLVHLSYNALPAWQGALGMQRLIYEAGVRTIGRSDVQAQAGLAVARDLKGVESRYLTESSITRDLLDTTVAMSTEYLPHEYMSAHWAPAFHADVAAALAEAKLDWVSSINPMENFPELMLTPEQRDIMNRYKDPILRELIKDMCLPRQLRHDLFVRGARRLYNDQRDAALSRLTVVPIVSPGELQTEIHVPAGMAEVGDKLQNMMAAAVRGPATVGELLALGGGRNPAELVGVLVGSHQCQIAVRSDGDQPESANRLNRVFGSRVNSIVAGKTPGALASSRLGTGLTAPPLLQFIAARLLSGERESSADAWIKALSADVVPEKHDTVRHVVHTAIEQRLPILRRLGIVPD
ncbi:MAG: methyltransferase regulatory domain-containing protein [Proteobacteria bacterium]|nr:methyltransferase regulatory domain-containing protein [Pseudomonadota bacterium]